MSIEEQTSGLSYSELSRMRGEIVSGLANIESGMCKFITAYFIDPKLENPKWLEFQFKFLYHESLHFSIKKDIFKMICERKKVNDFPFGELTQLQKIRNKFAHSWVVHFEDESQDLFLLDEFGKKNAKAHYEDYKKLYEKVYNALLETVKNEEWYSSHS